MAPHAAPRLISNLDPKQVLDSLSSHMLVDGYHVVMDLKRSHGNFIYDSLHDVEVLDFYSHFATCPIGYAHPKVTTPEFLEELAWAAVTKPANSDIYTEQMALFVETFARLSVPTTHAKHMFFVEGGALAIENALKAAFDWKVRRNFRKGHRREVGTKILHFEQAFHGRSGYTLSLTNTSDPRKTMYFPKFDWPRVVNPKLTFPLTPEIARADGRRRGARDPPDPPGSRGEPGRRRGAHHGADPGRGRRQPLPPGVPQAAPDDLRRERHALHPRRGADGHGPHGVDVGLPGARRRAGHVHVRQEDAGLRLRLERPDHGRARERLQRLLADQLDVGREPRRHGALPQVPRDHGRGEPRREREDDGRVPARQARRARRPSSRAR